MVWKIEEKADNLRRRHLLTVLAVIYFRRVECREQELAAHLVLHISQDQNLFPFKENETTLRS